MREDADVNRRPELPSFSPQAGARTASHHPLNEQAQGGKRPSPLGRRDRRFAAEAAVARALAEHRIGVGQQAHRRLARLRAGGIADPRDRREGRHAAFGDGSAGCLYRGGCDASRSGAGTRPAPLTSLLWTGATLESRPPDPRIASVSGQSCLVRSNYVSNGKVWGPSTCHMSNYRERQQQDGWPPTITSTLRLSEGAHG